MVAQLMNFVSLLAVINYIMDEPTHISGNSLDLVFSDVPSLVSSSVGAFIGSSDHCHLNIKIEVNQHIPKCTF